ncbi:transketolase [Acidobacteria bacterium Mor1]|nr:transketolase [Acidobacteria bacterium Mor1]
MPQSKTSLAESHGISRESIVRDYRLAFQSRQASIIGRKEVFTGKAKFGIFGDGKEIAQLAMARAFRKGDFRSGYYRDQTFMFATGMTSLANFFAQLYAHPELEHDPSSSGRSMTAHFATRMLNEDGSWKRLRDEYNSASDISPTGSQMPRLVGLGLASRLFRELEGLEDFEGFSDNGNEVAFGTIGNASCAEGMFWEAINAIGVLQAPVVMSVWDDGYGISVPNHIQVTKGNISELLAGFQRKKGTNGYDIYTVKAWDYPALVETYLNAAETARKEHVPAIIHVLEMTQPSGHSTSGSHERYKSKERLQWEKDFDGIAKMREWMISQKIATAKELDAFDAEDKQHVLDVKTEAWDAFHTPIREELDQVVGILDQLAWRSPQKEKLEAVRDAVKRIPTPLRRDIMHAVQEALVLVRDEDQPARKQLIDWKHEQTKINKARFSSHLYIEGPASALEIPPVAAQAGDETLRGFEVLNRCFDEALGRHPNLVVFGEDVGQLGDVNQGFSGMQEKYGELRVSDTGIRETTIVGQGIGLAMRGFRPLLEIQYLDYVLYALQIMSDDLCSLHYRTRGGQKAPVIIRTRGHRLEGIWHAGSPMAGMLGLVRGMYVCVPRNMTQAAGMYNTLLASDDSAIVVEVLNGYRLKEQLPGNIGDFKVPLGHPEVIREGSDVTVVTYGACCRIAEEAAELLADAGISIEIVDVQTLLPFDLDGRIVDSLQKTSRLLVLDEDVPGGASAFMLQQILEQSGGFRWLDSAPRTLTSEAHRPAYGSDGDYWSKPNRDDVFNAVYEIMRESDPSRFPQID